MQNNTVKAVLTHIKIFNGITEAMPISLAIYIIPNFELFVKT